MTINADYVENAPTLAQLGSALFRYVAKMAAVEYEKCTSPHTSRFDRLLCNCPVKGCRENTLRKTPGLCSNTRTSMSTLKGSTLSALSVLT